MDGWAIDWVKEIEEEIHVDFAGEESARWWVEEEGALDEVEGADNEHVVCAIASAAEEMFETGY